MSVTITADVVDTQNPLRTIIYYIEPNGGGGTISQCSVDNLGVENPPLSGTFSCNATISDNQVTTTARVRALVRDTADNTGQSTYYEVLTITND